MLHKPDLADETLAAALRAEYGLRPAEITFLPLGADWRCAVFRVVADDGAVYFLKLRSSAHGDAGDAVSRFLYDHGITEVMPPIPTTEGRLATPVDRFALLLYPFVDGQDANDRTLSDVHWRQIGDALRRVHGARLPEDLAARVPRDVWAPTARDAVRGYLVRAAHERFADPAADEVAALLRAEQARVMGLVDRADALAGALRTSPPPVVLCHGDWHPGNAFVGRDGALRVVDWDTPVFAPRERDLSLVGAGWGGPREAELFYAGYGPVAPDSLALTYYRHDRVVEDIAIDCAMLFDSPGGGASRDATLAFLLGTIRPGGRIDVVRELGEDVTIGRRPPPGAAGTRPPAARIRPVRLADVAACAEIEAGAFPGASSRQARQLIGRLVRHPGVYGVVAEEGGAIVGHCFLYEHDPIRAVGPLAVPPAAQGRGVGRRLMEAVLARAEGAAGVRLTQAPHHAASFALYVSLGFEVKEPLVMLSGRFRSGPRVDATLRPMREGDLPAAAALCERVHGFARPGDLREALGTGAEPVVLEREGRIVAYASHRRLGDDAHGVAEAEDDLRALLLGLAPPGGAEHTIRVPTRQASLLHWCLEEGLRVGWPQTLMAMGEYREPRGAYLPSSWY